MVVSLDDLKSAQRAAGEQLSTLGIDYETLTEPELEKVVLSFNRQLVLGFPQREISDIFVRHKTDIIIGAMVARAQMDAEIGGEQPDSNKVGGPIVTRAGWLGIGDDWDDANSWTTGSPQNWIHSGTTLLGGTAGNAIKIGENVVHVILGIASLHPSPKIESIKNWIDDKPKPTIVTKFTTFRQVGSLAVKEFDNSILLYKDKTFLTKVFISSAFGTTANDIPMLVGVSYIKEPQLRIQDPYELAGTASARDVNKVVLTT